MAVLDGLRRRRHLREAEGRLRELGEELGQRNNSLEFMTERIAELELTLEDEGWMRLGMQGAQDFTREGLRKITSLARVMYLKNPLIHRAVAVQVYYVFGQGVHVRATDEEVDAAVQEAWDDPANRAELSAHQHLEGKETELQVAGNLFFALNVTPANGRVRIRSIPVVEVDDIITSPDDRREPWYYVRRWQQREAERDSLVWPATEHVELYPDWRYRPDDQPAEFGGYPVNWDMPVMHVKVGGTDQMKFGIPDFYAAIDWARAYKEFLEDWATITRSLSRWAWRLTAKGGKKGRAAAKKKLNTTLAPSEMETNPAPQAGSVAIFGEGADLTPIPKTGAHVSAQDGRELRTMVAAGTDIPDTMLAGDPDMGTLATAKTLDRPTELAMRSRQMLWADVFRDMANFVVLEKVRAGLLPGTIEPQDDSEVVVPPADRDYAVTVDFPSILEHDVGNTVKAIVDAATLAGNAPAGTMPAEVVSRLLLTALAHDDVDGAIEDLNLPAGAPENAGVNPAEEQLHVAARELVEAVRRIRLKAV